MYKIQFKTKLKNYGVLGQDDSDYKAIEYKKKLTRKDCDLNATKHNWYNSDMFESMLNRAYKETIGQYTNHSDITKLPEFVSIDTSKFLAVVTIEIHNDKYQQKI